MEVDSDVRGVTIAPMDPAVSTVFISWEINNGLERADVIFGDQMPVGRQIFFIQTLLLRWPGPWSATYSIQKE